MIWKRIKKATDKEQADFEERMKEEKLDRKDKFAIVISAFYMIVLPCLLVLLFLALILFLMFRLF